MRIVVSSAAVSGTALVPGRDLVLRLDERHAAAVPPGAYALDLLDAADRARLDRECGRLLAEWRARYDAALTIDGVCLPYVWEHELMSAAVLPTLVTEAALLRAVEAHEPRALEVVDGDEITSRLVADVARRTGATAVGAVDSAPSLRPWTSQPQSSPLRRLRRRAVAAARARGVPSHVRTDAVLVVGYWSNTGIVDRLLADGGRPAVHVELPPPGPRRTLRAALRGGWLGAPSPDRVGRHGARVGAALAALPPPDGLTGRSAAVDAAVHGAIMAYGRERGGLDLARAETARRALHGRRARWIVLPFDSVPDTRSLLVVARELGISTLNVAHGGYWIPTEIRDLEEADEVAVWSEQALPMIRRRDRPIHVVGYPVAGAQPGTRRRNAAPRVVVLEQVPLRDSALLDERMPLRHYGTAIRAIERALPGAEIVLRPHPSRGITGASSVVPEQFPGSHIEVDVSTPIVDLFGSADLCVGSLSTATLQAPLGGADVVALDLTGRTWPWPLDGGSAVPVARSEDELAAQLRAQLEEPSDAAADELARALGLDGGDAPERVVDLVRRPAGASPPSRQPLDAPTA